jgi:hypothetical protein
LKKLNTVKNPPVKNAMDNTDEFLKQVRERMQQHIDEPRDANPTEPVIIEGRPFTPEDFQHLDELNEELQKDTHPMTQMELQSYWGLGLLPQSARELAHARFFGRPIIIEPPTSEKTEE